jgi:hypothetical protein
MRSRRPVLSRAVRKRLHSLMVAGVTTTGFLAFLTPGTIALNVVGSATAFLTAALLADDLRRRGRNHDSGAPQDLIRPQRGEANDQSAPKSSPALSHGEIEFPPRMSRAARWGGPSDRGLSV